MEMMLLKKNDSFLSKKHTHTPFPRTCKLIVVENKRLQLTEGSEFRGDGTCKALDAIRHINIVRIRSLGRKKSRQREASLCRLLNKKTYYEVDIGRIRRYPKKTSVSA